MTPRPYQSRMKDATRASLQAGNRRVIVVGPTGSGKSHVSAEIVVDAELKGSSIRWLVHRRNLVFQFAKTLRQYGVEPGIIMAGEDPDLAAQTQIGTIDTARSRPGPPGDILIIDEAHRSLSPSYQKIIDQYRYVIGTTATPCRADGRGMGEVYDDIVDVVGVKELTDEGFLCPIRYFCPAGADLSKIKTVLGDYEKKGLGAAVDKPKYVGDIVDTYLDIGEGRKAIVFAINVKHSIHIRDEFERRGVPAAHLDARSSDAERDRVFDQMQSGEVRVVMNVGLYIEGMDVPEIGYVGLGYGTKSLGKYRQMVGRGMRPKPGGGDLIVADHGGNVEEHEPVDTPVIWTLDGKKKAWNRPTPEPKEKKDVICKACNRVFQGSATCPDCGSPVKSFGKKIEFVEGSLVELGGAKPSQFEKRIFYGMAKKYVRKKGWKEGAAAHIHRGFFGTWPNKYKSVAEIEPDAAFLGRMTYEQIKWRKGKRA